jgi:hypothetical protein
VEQPRRFQDPKGLSLVGSERTRCPGRRIETRKAKGDKGGTYEVYITVKGKKQG